ncbi:MAG: SufD family Fe-S cluster assembly protein [Candidatus Thorarchaeota archaeon]
MTTNYRELAEGSKQKKASLGTDIDIAAYAALASDRKQLQSLNELPSGEQALLTQAGFDSTTEKRSGSYLLMDHSVCYEKSSASGLEVLDIRDALEKYDGLSNYYWKAVSVDADKYTANAELRIDGGYFIRVAAGTQIDYPLQSCLFMTLDESSQRVHNIIIVEEEAHLKVLSGCVTSALTGLHLGVSEFFIEKNASLTFTMIHNWAENIEVRPRTVTIVEEGGSFTSNYVALRPVKSVQMAPKTYLRGKGASARLSSVLYAHPGSELDIGGEILLEAPNTSGEIISRAITAGGKIWARGRLVGDAPGVRARMQCDGLLLTKEAIGFIDAIPELQACHPEVEMSHEAALGRVGAEEVEYLMARGLTEDEATALIIRGFLDIGIEGIGPELATEIEEIVKESAKGL